MTLAISSRTNQERPDVTILDLEGRITLAEGSAVLNKEIIAQLAQQHKFLVLNFNGVSYIDNSGMGELVSAYTTVRNQGGELKLLNPTRTVHDILQITKLYTVFDVKDDEASVVASFHGGTAALRPGPSKGICVNHRFMT